ncbi:PREDICTED: kinesin-like protein KIF20B isoform X2 [Dinoponera quadriceps]|nr:PREDICTED: kinesin-like protein KIF20B isoform X2 [Dinoponera quadriceps]
MENTLDSIRPSDNQQEEMSYLFGRDPSILAYSQRPFPSKDTKKNLLLLYEIEENNSTGENVYERSESLQTVRVYLRLKPFSKNLKLTEEQQDAYKIINSTTLVTKLPMLDNTISSIKQSKSNENISRKFTFSQTFGPETTQLELFEQTVQQQMIDFLAGYSCTIMTYGTTNSGKSYTLQGTTTSPGLIPRALEFVFSNITTRPNPSYKPLHYCDVVSLNALERAQELEAKTKLLTFSSVDKHQYINAYKEMQKLLQEESVRPSQCHDAHYSIWVSFAEIYNEIVYDLLSNECQKKRIPLKLGTDSSGRAFIKGLRTIYVNSAAEAYQVLMAGQYNLKIAATALNAKSSRSHCIFTITLLKYCAENLPDTVEVSTFSFCDLAGSERLKKTLNIGDRLKEAQNINTSLLVLGRCLKSIHEGQERTRAKTDAVGPFRESKLTRLFQRALSGKEHLALIVNVNPLPNLYTETQNVLNFAAIAKRIVIEEKKQVSKEASKPKSRFSRIAEQSRGIVTDWDATELESMEDWQQHTTAVSGNASEYVSSEEYMDLANENEKLKKEIAVLKKSALSRDLQSRQEMADKYIAMINELEVYWKQRVNDAEVQHEDTLEWTVKQVQEFYEEKLNQLHRKKRRRTDCTDDDDDDDDYVSENSDYLNVTLDLGEKNTQLQVKIEALKQRLTELKTTNETSIMEKNKINFELALSKEDLKVVRNLLKAAQKDICLNQDGKFFAEEITSQLLAKDEQIIKLKEFLNEAKKDYITATSDLRKKELCVDEQTKIIIENEEKIEDVESHLEQVNVCLMEKTRMIEVLEEKYERQSEKLSDAQNVILQLQEEIERLKDEKLALLVQECEKRPILPESSQCLDKTTNTSDSILTSAVVDNNIVEELVVKEELIIDDRLSDDESQGKRDTAENGIHSLENRLPSSSVACTTVSKATDSATVGTTSPTKSDKSHCDINLERCVCYKSTATAEVQVDCAPLSKREKAVQTDEDKLQAKELVARYDKIQAQYEEKCLSMEKLTEEFCDVNKIVKSLKEENQSSKIIIDEYGRSMEALEKQLSLVTEEKHKIEEALLTSNAEAKFTKYQHEIDRLEKKDLAKDDARQYLETTRKELDASRCRGGEEGGKQEEEKEQRQESKDEFAWIKDEKEQRDMTSSSNDIDVEQPDEHLETSVETIAKLKEDIVRLNENLETCLIEKNHMQNALERNNKRLLELENRLEGTVLKEQEKDTEIATLQKELKRMIQRDDDEKTKRMTDDCMEVELKSAISELTRTKEALSEKEHHIKELKIHLGNFERNAKLLNLLEENAKERQMENERLRNINDELRSNMTQKEHEMDAFVKNRDEMMTKYEALVRNQQEELDMQKREVMRYQELFRRQMTPNKEDYKKLQKRVQELQDALRKYEAGGAKAKDYSETVSEAEAAAQQPKRRGKKTISSVKQEDIPVVELSGSESKRSAKRIALPTGQSSTGNRRTTRKKKLFVVTDSFADIEPMEDSAEVVSTTLLPTRNLRSRKK